MLGQFERLIFPEFSLDSPKGVRRLHTRRLLITESSNYTLNLCANFINLGKRIVVLLFTFI